MAIRNGRALAAAAALVLAAAAWPAQAAETVLRITLQLPLDSHIGQNLVRFKQEVESRSNGAIEVQIFDSAQLFRDKDVPVAVRAGDIEMGTVPLIRLVPDVPAVAILNMPFLFNTEQLARDATAIGSNIRGPLDEEILRKGTRVLWWQAFGGTIMLSNGAPLRTPDTLKGRPVRVLGETEAKFMHFIGAEPKLISGSEQFAAYRDGTVDAGMTGISSVQSRALWEVMDTVTVTNHAIIMFVVLINEDVWQDLPNEQKAIIDTAAANAESAIRAKFSAMETEAFQAARANGMSIYELSPEEVESWRKAAQPVYDDFRNYAGALGARMQQAARSLLRKYGIQ